MNTWPATSAAESPIPVRFFHAETGFLREAKSATGVPVVELVRRSVRLMQRQQQLLHSYGFILDLTREENHQG